jgi:hypothetical protein
MDDDISIELQLLKKDILSNMEKARDEVFYAADIKESDVTYEFACSIYKNGYCTAIKDVAMGKYPVIYKKVK